MCRWHPSNNHPPFPNFFPSLATHKHKVMWGSIRCLCNLIPIRKALLGIFPVALPLVFLRQIFLRIDANINLEELLYVPINHKLVEGYIIIEGVPILEMIIQLFRHDIRCLIFRHHFLGSALFCGAFVKTVPPSPPFQPWGRS